MVSKRLASSRLSASSARQAARASSTSVRKGSRASNRALSATPATHLGKGAKALVAPRAPSAAEHAKASHILETFQSTAEIEVPKRTVDQVIGQEKAVHVIKQAAAQQRNVLLVGTPGTGKSMLAQSMAELMPVEDLQDVLIAPNPRDENVPKVRLVKAGQGRKVVEAAVLKARMNNTNPSLAISVLLFFASLVLLYFGRQELGDIITAALLIGLFAMGGILALSMAVGRGRPMMNAEGTTESFKLVVDNAGKKTAPFIDATGARAGSLLGDCRHDPLQSGGLGTPPHLRVEAGFIHKAHKGVLFIDEISALRMKSQQELLTALQEKKYSITGQSEMSSGAMVHTEPVPCDFVLIAAGNFEDVRKMHPALRSRVRGYGYEVFMEDSLPDTPAHRLKLVQFIAQEVTKDGKIPHFSRDAAFEIIREAQRRGGRKHRLTLQLRELGGLVRAAGDLAREKGATLVTAEHVQKAKRVALTAEEQMATQMIDVRKEYEVFSTTGKEVGKVNGLAVMGRAGIVMPIVAEVAPAQSKTEGRIIATGKLGDIAKEAVENVSAIIKRHTGKDTTAYDVHIQFLQTYEGVEGDSASVSVATAVISALENAPIDQHVAMTGSISVRGDVLPVGGVTSKVEAAIEAGLKKVVIPFANKDDLVLEDSARKKIEIHTAKTLADVLEIALTPSATKQKLLAQIRKELK